MGKGVGWEHARRRALLPSPVGMTCPRCEQVIRAGEAVDAGHTIDRALGGANSALRWEHSFCNRSAGTTTRMTLAGRPPRTWVERWA